jgi:hypothetical protein
MKKETRIYQVLTGSGGKVVLSYVAGEIRELTNHGAENRNMNQFRIEFKKLHPKGDWDYDHSIIGTKVRDLFRQGYVDQRYAIEIKDVRAAKLHITDFLKDKKGKYEQITRTPQGFQYAHLCLGIDEHHQEQWEDVILMSIHPQWADMIKDGTKTLEFRDRLPNLLKEGI